MKLLLIIILSSSSLLAQSTLSTSWLEISTQIVNNTYYDTIRFTIEPISTAWYLQTSTGPWEIATGEHSAHTSHEIASGKNLPDLLNRHVDELTPFMKLLLK